jgi:hypothetical protein
VGDQFETFLAFENGVPGMFFGEFHFKGRNDTVQERTPQLAPRPDPHVHDNGFTIFIRMREDGRVVLPFLAFIFTKFLDVVFQADIQDIIRIEQQLRRRYCRCQHQQQDGKNDNWIDLFFHGSFTPYSFFFANHFT